jgi:hypothetical protein
LLKSMDTYEMPAPIRVAPAEWLDNAVERAQRDFHYYAKQHAEELTRCEDANRWIDALYESLNRTPATV